MNEKLNTHVTEDLVWLAIESLREEDLLKNGESIKAHFGNLSRRQIIRKVGLATMIALPLVSSLIAPTAAMAQSAARCTDNTLCVNSSTCTPACPTCTGLGICGAGGATTCTNIGGNCSVTGTCQDAGGGLKFCSVDAITPCTTVGTPCTVTGFCFGSGVCR